MLGNLNPPMTMTSKPFDHLTSDQCKDPGVMFNKTIYFLQIYLPFVDFQKNIY